jgi:hypothetical protein
MLNVVYFLCYVILLCFMFVQFHFMFRVVEFEK